MTWGTRINGYKQGDNGGHPEVRDALVEAIEKIKHVDGQNLSDATYWDGDGQFDLRTGEKIPPPA